MNGENKDRKHGSEEGGDWVNQENASTFKKAAGEGGDSFTEPPTEEEIDKAVDALEEQK